MPGGGGWAIAAADRTLIAFVGKAGAEAMNFVLFFPAASNPAGAGATAVMSRIVGGSKSNEALGGTPDGCGVAKGWCRTGVSMRLGVRATVSTCGRPTDMGTSR